MRLNQSIAVVLLSASLLATSCGPKDTEVATAAQQVLPADVNVEVKDGVATLTGLFKDDVAKKAAEEAIAKIKGVKSVVDNATIAPTPSTPMPAVTAVVSAADELLMKGIKDATKDFSTVTADVKDGIITLSGEIKKASLPKLMMALNALKPKKINSNLTVK